MKKSRNPYNNTRKRKAALAFLAARGITQVKPLYVPTGVQHRAVRLLRVVK